MLTLNMADAYGMPPDPFSTFVRRVMRAVACAVLGMLPFEKAARPLRDDAWTQ